MKWNNFYGESMLFIISCANTILIINFWPALLLLLLLPLQFRRNCEHSTTRYKMAILFYLHRLCTHNWQNIYTKHFSENSLQANEVVCHKNFNYCCRMNSSTHFDRCKLKEDYCLCIFIRDILVCTTIKTLGTQCTMMINFSALTSLKCSMWERQREAKIRKQLQTRAKI